MQYRALIESVQDYAIFTIDGDGRVSSWNLGAQRIFGYASEEIVRQPAARLFTLEDCAAGIPDRELATARTAGRAPDKRWHQRKDGSRFFADGIVTAARGPTGELVGFTKVLQDVTERERQFQQQTALLESTGEGIYAIDNEGCCTFINRAARELLGYAAEAVHGHNMHALVHHHRLDGSPYPVEACAANAALHGKVVRIDDDVLWRRDGVPLSVEYSSHPICQGGVITGAVIAFRDITARKQAEAALGQLGLLLDLSHDAVFVRDTNATLTYWNTGAEELYGFAKDEAVGKNVHRLLKTRFPPLPAPLDDVLRDGGRWEGELAHTCKDGRQVVVESRQVLMRDGGATLAILETNRDVTARKQAETERERSLAGIAHDLRNPLASIKGFVQLGQRQLRREGRSEADRLMTGLASIDAATDKMTGMLGELLDVARLESGGRLELDLIATDLVDLARTVAAEYQRIAVRHVITLETSEPELLGVWDGRRLERALANLLSNAIKFSPQGGMITVTLGCDSEQGRDWAWVRVQDHGVGIPPADIPRIFERFYRATNVAGRIGGTGLGLAGAKAIVEQHGGTLTVASRVGESTTVTVRLPLG